MAYDMLSWIAENYVHDLHMKDVCVLESVKKRLRPGYSQMFRRTGFGASSLSGRTAVREKCRIASSQAGQIFCGIFLGSSLLSQRSNKRHTSAHTLMFQVHSAVISFLW